MGDAEQFGARQLIVIGAGESWMMLWLYGKLMKLASYLPRAKLPWFGRRPGARQHVLAVTVGATALSHSTKLFPFPGAFHRASWQQRRIWRCKKLSTCPRLSPFASTRLAKGNVGSPQDGKQHVYLASAKIRAAWSLFCENQACTCQQTRAN